jgi:hypothetical protein
MRRDFWIYMGIVFLGVIVVALPDDDNRIFSISDSHGPALMDLAGLTLVLVPWLLLATIALIKWRAVLQRLGRRLITALLAAVLIGTLVLVVSFRSGSGHWLTGAAISFVGQMVLIVAAFRKAKK